MPLRGFGRASTRAATGNKIRLELSVDGRQIFAIGGPSDSIAVLARDSRTGTLRQLPGASGCITSTRTAGCATLSAMAKAEVVLSPDGRTLGLISDASGNRLVFDRNPRTGALRRIGIAQRCVAALDGPCVAVRGVARRDGTIQLSPDSLLVFGTSPPGSGAVAVLTCTSPSGCLGGGAVAVLTRTSPAGRWHQPKGRGGCANAQGSSGCSTVACLPPSAALATLSSDRHEVYVTGGRYDIEFTGEGSLSTFRRRSDGSLIPLGCVRTGHDSQSGFSPAWISPLPGTRALLVLQVRGNRGDGIAWERMFAAVPGPSGALRAPRQISATLSGGQTPLSLSADGRTLYVVDSDLGNLGVYRVAATAVRPLARPWFQPYRAPVWLSYGAEDLLRSPDGRFVYLAAGPGLLPRDRHAPQLRVYRVAR
jgi:hypothetical protein